jgi:hypothetical protein
VKGGRLVQVNRAAFDPGRFEVQTWVVGIGALGRTIAVRNDPIRNYGLVRLLKNLIATEAADPRERE